MIRRLLPGCALALLALQTGLADEKLRADLTGTIVLRGPVETVQHRIEGKISLTSRLGSIRKMEVYTEWSGPNEIRQKMREFYQVRGSQFAGYVEREYKDPLGNKFSRTQVSGTLSQTVRASTGEGRIEWTISESDTTTDTGINDENDTDGDLIPDDIDPEIDQPVVTADEEGTLDIVITRKIKFDPGKHRIDRPAVELQDSADETVEILVTPIPTPTPFGGGGSLGGSTPTPTPTPTPSPTPQSFVRSVDATLEGIGKGTLAFDEDEADRITRNAIDAAEAAASATPTPTPTATPNDGSGDGFVTPTPTPSGSTIFGF